MDFLQDFFDEHIEFDKSSKASNKDIYAIYKNYANESGEYVMTARALSERIKEKIENDGLPIKHHKDNRGVQWIGIRLKTNIENDLLSREESGLYAVK
jgi:phage/plasmid-associated DNA primase